MYKRVTGHPVDYSVRTPSLCNVVVAVRQGSVFVPVAAIYVSPTSKKSNSYCKKPMILPEPYEYVDLRNIIITIELTTVVPFRSNEIGIYNISLNFVFYFKI